jgi:ribosomal protein S18 acetylase RimI-like enzyme
MGRLDPEHLDAMCNVQRLIVEALDDPSLYYPNPRDIFALCLSQRGLVIGTFVAGTLVAFRSVFFPGERPDNLGLDIGLTAGDLDQVAHLERSVVDPAYRGNRLQMRMTTQAVQMAKDHPGYGGRLRHLFSTVSPANIPSMKDKFSIGMQIVRTKKKYLGYWRHVFYRDIREPVTIDLASSVRVDVADIPRQALLVETRGYVGYGVAREGDALKILYAQPERPIRRAGARMD